MSTQTPESICNLALDKLGADPIASISAPVKANERLLARQYPFHRDALLRSHRWLFAKATRRLTPTGSPITNDIDDRLYRYTMPTDAVRAIRRSGTTWQVRGRELLDPSDSHIDVEFIVQVETAKFDPLFTDALVCRIAEAICEKISMSTDKKQDLKDDYKRAMDDARRTNAFELGPEVVTGGDDAYSWLTSRTI